MKLIWFVLWLYKDSLKIFVFGVLAQMIGGFQKLEIGNNIGWSAFTAWGSSWIGLGIIWMLNAFKIYESSHTDVGLYLVAWTLYTAIMFVASLRIHTAMAFTLGTLLLGFILLDLGHFGNPVFNLIAGYELIVCAFAAWYMMAGIIINDLAGKTVLKMGNPLIR